MQVPSAVRGFVSPIIPYKSFHTVPVSVCLLASPAPELSAFVLRLLESFG